MRIFWLAPVLFLAVACGEDNTPNPDSATPQPINPITYEQVMDRRWVAPVDGAFITVELEDGMMSYDDQGNELGAYRGFHLRVCETPACDTTYLFFAVGKFEIQKSNDLCFKEIRFWTLPPQDLHYQTITRVPGVDYEEYTTADFCAISTIDASGKLSAIVSNERGSKQLDFISERLEY